MMIDDLVYVKTVAKSFRTYILFIFFNIFYHHDKLMRIGHTIIPEMQT